MCVCVIISALTRREAASGRSSSSLRSCSLDWAMPACAGAWVNCFAAQQSVSEPVCLCVHTDSSVTKTCRAPPGAAPPLHCGLACSQQPGQPEHWAAQQSLSVPLCLCVHTESSVTRTCWAPPGGAAAPHWDHACSPQPCGLMQCESGQMVSVSKDMCVCVYVCGCMFDHVDPP